MTRTLTVVVATCCPISLSEVVGFLGDWNVDASPKSTQYVASIAAKLAAQGMRCCGIFRFEACNRSPIVSHYPLCADDCVKCGNVGLISLAFLESGIELLAEQEQQLVGDNFVGSLLQTVEAEVRCDACLPVLVITIITVLAHAEC